MSLVFASGAILGKLGLTSDSPRVVDTIAKEAVTSYWYLLGVADAVVLLVLILYWCYSRFSRVARQRREADEIARRARARSSEVWK